MKIVEDQDRFGEIHQQPYLHSCNSIDVVVLDVLGSGYKHTKPVKRVGSHDRFHALKAHSTADSMLSGLDLPLLAASMPGSSILQLSSEARVC